MKGNAGGGVGKGAPSGGPSVVRPTVYTVYTSRRDPCRRGKKNNFFGGALRVSPECVHNVHFADTVVLAGVRDAHGPVQSVPGRCTRCTRFGAERPGPVYTTYTVRCRASRAGVHDVHSPVQSVQGRWTRRTPSGANPPGPAYTTYTARYPRPPPQPPTAPPRKP